MNPAHAHLCPPIIFMDESTAKIKKAAGKYISLLQSSSILTNEIYSLDLISNADFILVAAGAGFSADSGLPVYK